MRAVDRLIISSEKGSKNVREGRDYSTQALEMLSVVVNSAELTNDAAKQISLSTHQQQIASSQVLSALREIEEGTRYSSATIQQFSSVSKDLKQISIEFEEFMNQFQLEINPKTN